MNKNNLKKNYSDSDDDYKQGKKGASGKDKSSKRRLSIYDEYEEDDEIFPHQEKFKNRRK